MRYFDFQGPDWGNKKTMQEEPPYKEHHVHVSEVINQRGEKISLGGQETQSNLSPEQGNFRTISRDVVTTLACGCVSRPDLKVRVFRDGRTMVCHDHYYTCGLCSREILPQEHMVIQIGDRNIFFHRHPCAGYVLNQLIQNERINPTLPQGSIILLENMYADLRASRSWVYRLLTGRRSNNELFHK